jgi:adenosylcobinamide-GDP ribazoletransferase
MTLASLPIGWAVPALLFAHTASRSAAVGLIRWLPYAGDMAHAKAKPLAQRVSMAGVAVAAGWAVAVAVAAGLWAWQPQQVVALALSAALVVLGTAWCARWLRRRLGGTTGDTLGAAQQITELLALLGWLAAERFAVSGAVVGIVGSPIGQAG